MLLAPKMHTLLHKSRAKSNARGKCGLDHRSKAPASMGVNDYPAAQTTWIAWRAAFARRSGRFETRFFWRSLSVLLDFF